MVQIKTNLPDSKTHLTRIHITSVVMIFTTVIFLLSCTVSSEKLEFSRAEEAAQKNDSQTALTHYKNVVDRFIKTPMAIQAAKEAAQISHYQLKRPSESIFFYKHIILYSPTEKDRIDAQKKLADLLFTELLDYKQAIVEYSRLLDLPHGLGEDCSIRLSIARSYFYLANFFQALEETETILSKKYDSELMFDATLLKANIFITTKKYDEAVGILKEIMSKYPERSKNETIGLVLAVTYEEQKNFSKAIETLESIKNLYPKKAFIESRIKTLKERQSYLPGARGWKK